MTMTTDTVMAMSTLISMNMEPTRDMHMNMITVVTDMLTAKKICR